MPGAAARNLNPLVDGDCGFDLDRHVKGQRGHANSGASVGASFGTVEREDKIGAAVNHGGLLGEVRRAVHHPVQAQPGGDAIEVAEFPLEAAEHRERDRLGQVVRLCDCDINADFAEGTGY